MQCPHCHSETLKLIYVNEGFSDARVGCPSCHEPRKRFSNCSLGQVQDKFWNKATNRWSKITTGKNWEIEHRRISKDDPKVVINNVTGKEMQY